MVTVPVHPAYVDAPTAGVRAYLSAPMTGNDPAKAARQIHKIAGDANVPLRIPLGHDSIAVVTAELDSIKADVEKAGPWAADLA